MAKIQTDRREFIKYSTLGLLGAVLGGGIVFSPYALHAERIDSDLQVLYLRKIF